MSYAEINEIQVMSQVWSFLHLRRQPLMALLNISEF